MSASEFRSRRRRFFPDVAILVVTLVAAALLVVASWNLWPAGENVPIAIGAAVMVLIGAGGAWLTLSVLASSWHRRWTWWFIAYPTVVAVAVIASLTGRPTFEQSRSGFEEVAQYLLSEPGRTHLTDLRIGRLDIKYAYATHAGEVYFHDARNGPLARSNPGWVYSPNGSPPGFSRLGMKNIGSNWYRFTNVTVD
ncbi:hypothetical protein [Rhodococcus sp. NPDC049939]|uniref:hypothetical protein n=1 Tax=Rhodococcus sp. NPDC049939 TaxID=3155511 RepID=UPI00340D3DF3